MWTPEGAHAPWPPSKRASGDLNKEKNMFYIIDSIITYLGYMTPGHCKEAQTYFVALSPKNFTGL